MKTKASVQNVSIPKGCRVIAISDIHGSCDVLKKLLKKVSLSPEDILVLVGDVLEKGTQSLETVRYLMELAESHTIYKAAGNVDVLYEDIFEAFTRENGETLMSYLLRKDRKQGILHQMSREIGFEISEDMDIFAWWRALKERFPKELEFLRGWPQIISTDKAVFVHGGLASDNLEEQDSWKCRKNDNFMSQGLYFSRMVIVGHWPVSIYLQDGTINQNPRIDWVHNICSIDGGMVVKKNGQLNALILPDGDPKRLSYTYVSPYPEAEALDSQEETKCPTSLVWGEERQYIEILEQKDDISLCRQIITGNKFWIPSSYLYTEKNGRLCAAEGTTYHHLIRPGDRFNLLYGTGIGYLILKDGVIGWYKGRVQELETQDGKI